MFCLRLYKIITEAFVSYIAKFNMIRSALHRSQLELLQRQFLRTLVTEIGWKRGLDISIGIWGQLMRASDWLVWKEASTN